MSSVDHLKEEAEMILPRLLRRNRFGFRLRRRSFSNRLLQLLVVLTVFFLFLYLLFYAINLRRDISAPDFSWLKTRNISYFVKPQENTLILEPTAESQCKREERLRLVIIVYSAPQNVEQRRVVRKTWAKSLKQMPGVKIFFMLGQAASKDIQNSLTQEQVVNNDLVQESFVDSYLNLTLKTSFMLKWLDSNDCASAKLVFKVDDDSFVNPQILWENLEHALLYTITKKSVSTYLPSPDERSNSPIVLDSESIDYLIMGHVQVAVPIRDPGSKWYLPSKFYPLNIFPKFLSGSGYVFSSSVVPMLYRCALKTPYMNLEDVFLTGLCGSTQLGLRLTHNPTFHFRKPLVGPNYVCYYKTNSLIHPVEAEELEEMFVRIADDHNCDTFYFGLVKILTKILDFFKNLFRF